MKARQESQKLKKRASKMKNKTKTNRIIRKARQESLKLQKVLKTGKKLSKEDKDWI